jgi:DNA polymerase-3 subunit delta'
MPLDPFPDWLQPAWERFVSMSTRQRLPHALLLSGPAGIGKRMLLQRAAAALLCDAPSQQQPCGTCRSCHLFAAGAHPDLLQLYPEERGKQLKVDQVRSMLEHVHLAAGADRHRVVMIDPADAMNASAANALLKTLEEPVAGVILLLCTDHPERLPATIRSRCQQIIVPLPPWTTALAWVSAHCADADAAELLQMASGAPMLALQLQQSGMADGYRDVRQGLLDLGAGHEGVLTLGPGWLKQMALDDVLSAMQSWSVQCARQLARGEAGEHGLQHQCKGLHLSNVLRFLERIDAVKREQQRNIRPQLALEHLLLHWRQLAASGRE